MTNPLDYLLPIDDSPESLRLYRLRVAVVACSSWLLLYLGVMPALVIGLPMIGRVAWAEDMEDKVDQYHRETVMPIQRDVAEIKAAVESIKESISAGAMTSMRNELREMRRLYCRAREAGNSELARRYARDIEYSREVYEKTSGTNWHMPQCEDI